MLPPQLSAGMSLSDRKPTNLKRGNRTFMQRRINLLEFLLVLAGTERRTAVHHETPEKELTQRQEWKYAHYLATILNNKVYERFKSNRGSLQKREAREQNLAGLQNYFSTSSWFTLCRVFMFIRIPEQRTQAINPFSCSRSCSSISFLFCYLFPFFQVFVHYYPVKSDLHFLFSSICPHRHKFSRSPTLRVSWSIKPLWHMMSANSSLIKGTWRKEGRERGGGRESNDRLSSLDSQSR